MNTFLFLIDTASAVTWTLIAVFALFALYLIISLFAVYKIYSKIFKVRGEDPDNPCYLRFQDYEKELERDDYQTGYYKKAINGYIYTRKGERDFKGFVILSHGFFGTHIQYLVDIYFLCSHGYKVLAYDQYGVGMSQGANQVSLANGIYVLENVIRDVEKRKLNGDLDLILYGHSWGSYCTLGAMRHNPQVKKAIMRSGFVSQNQVMLNLLKSYNRPLTIFLKPTFSLCSTLLLSRRLSISAKRGFKNKTTKCLVIQSEDDEMVPYKLSITKKAKGKKNYCIYLTEDGGHNTIITKDANENYQKAVAEYLELKKIASVEAIDAFTKSLNRRSMYPYREDVTRKIEEFLDS